MSQNRTSRISLVFSLFLSLGLILPTHLQAISLDPDDEDDVEIVVVPEEGESADPPRSPSVTRIDAWYSWSTCSVSACLSNAGSLVAAEFSNTSTSEYYYFEIPGNGLSVMPIGCSSGYWMVRFTLSSGTVYSGVFIL